MHVWLIVIVMTYFALTLLANGIGLAKVLAYDESGTLFMDSHFQKEHLTISQKFEINKSRSFRICHISDFHGGFEKIHNEVSIVDVCDSGLPISNYMSISHIMKNASCDLRIFTGDLMRGSEYDFYDSVFERVLKNWEIDYWVPGNHEFGLSRDILLGKITMSEHYNSQMVLSNVAFDLPAINKIIIDSEARGEDIPLIITQASSISERTRPYVATALSSGVRLCIYGVLNERTIPNHPIPGTLKITNAYDSLVSTINDSRIDGCLEPDVLRIIMTHVGYKQDVDITKRISDEFPDVIFPIVLGGHSHTILQHYPEVVGSTGISHVGFHGGAVGLINLERDDNFVWQFSLSDSHALKLSKIRSEWYGYGYNNPDQGQSPYTVLVITDSEREGICRNDNMLLAPTRNEIMSTSKKLFSQKVTPWKFPLQHSSECRSGPCYMGEFVSSSMVAMATAKSVDQIHCSKVSGNRKSSPVNFEAKDIAPDAFIAYTFGGVFRGDFLSDPNSILLRSAIPRNSDEDQLTGLHMFALMPFANRIRVKVLDTMDDICSLLSRELRLLTTAGKTAYLPQAANFHYFIDPDNRAFWRASPASLRKPIRGKPYKGKALWKLEKNEKVGIEVNKKDGSNARGFCDSDDTYHHYTAPTLKKVLLVVDEFAASFMESEENCWVPGLFDYTQQQCVFDYGPTSYEHMQALRLH